MKLMWFRKLLYKINRKHKDRLFCAIFGREKYKDYALQLYNAVNKSHYTNPSQLEIITLTDAVYIRMKNDVAYLMSDNMAVYEHQSTVNPNMPLRGFTYFGELYNKYVKLGNYNIYGKTLVKIPTPQYVVFYNGKQDYPEVSTLKLSDAFIKPLSDGAFEWTATVYNINSGKNPELVDSCEPLKGYCVFVEKTRKYSSSMSLEEAVDLAVRECIDEGILKDVLSEERSAVMLEILTTFDEKVYEAGLRQEAREEGLAEGKAEGLVLGKAEGRNAVNALNEILIREGRIDDLKRATVDPEYQDKLLSEFVSK